MDARSCDLLCCCHGPLWRLSIAACLLLFSTLLPASAVAGQTPEQAQYKEPQSTKTPQLIAAATEKISAEITKLIEDREGHGKATVWRHVNVPATAVPVDVAQALGSIAHEINMSSSAIGQWATHLQAQHFTAIADARKRYNKTALEASHLRHALASFARESDSKHREAAAKVAELDAVEKKLEVEVQRAGREGLDQEATAPALLQVSPLAERPSVAKQQVWSRNLREFLSVSKPCDASELAPVHENVADDKRSAIKSLQKEWLGMLSGPGESSAEKAAPNRQDGDEPADAGSEIGVPTSAMDQQQYKKWSKNLREQRKWLKKATLSRRQHATDADEPVKAELGIGAPLATAELKAAEEEAKRKTEDAADAVVAAKTAEKEAAKKAAEEKVAAETFAKKAAEEKTAAEAAEAARKKAVEEEAKAKAAAERVAVKAAAEKAAEEKAAAVAEAKRIAEVKAALIAAKKATEEKASAETLAKLAATEKSAGQATAKNAAKEKAPEQQVDPGAFDDAQLAAAYERAMQF